jgi:hypothetical protein
MTRCLSDDELQAIADGESRTGSHPHTIECARCAGRLDVRRRMIGRLVDAAGTGGLPDGVRDAMRASLGDGAPGAPRGATTLRPVRRAPGWVWAAGAATAAALAFFFVVVPGVDRQTTVSAAEILGRSRTALGVDVTGIEVLTYDLALEGLLGDLIPQDHAGRFTVEETIDHDREGRYRILKLAANGQIVEGAADDALRQTRVRYLRANGNGFLFRFTASEPTALSAPALKRAVLQTLITLMQTSSGQTLRELQRDGEACYQVEIGESLVPAGVPFALERARAVVTAADARLVEFSAAGSVADRPFTIDFALRSREMRPADSARDSDFDIAPQPGDVVFEGNVVIASSNPMWDIVSSALGAIHPAPGQPRSRR